MVNTKAYETQRQTPRICLLDRSRRKKYERETLIQTIKTLQIRHVGNTKKSELVWLLRQFIGQDRCLTMSVKEKRWMKSSYERPVVYTTKDMKTIGLVRSHRLSLVCLQMVTKLINQVSSSFVRRLIWLGKTTGFQVTVRVRFSSGTITIISWAITDGWVLSAQGSGWRSWVLVGCTECSERNDNCSIILWLLDFSMVIFQNSQFLMIFQ